MRTLQYHQKLLNAIATQGSEIICFEKGKYAYLDAALKLAEMQPSLIVKMIDNKTWEFSYVRS